jgi:hypothetical protein
LHPSPYSLFALFVMPRLTAELVASSPQFMNPLKERELDLRGNSIPAIENLGAARVRLACRPARGQQPAMIVACLSFVLFKVFPMASHGFTGSI